MMSFLGREVGVVAPISEVVVSRLGTFVHERGLGPRRVDVLLHPGPNVAPEEDRRSAREAAVHDAVQVGNPGRDLADPHAFERFRQRIHTEVDAIPR